MSLSTVKEYRIRRYNNNHSKDSSTDTTIHNKLSLLGLINLSAGISCVDNSVHSQIFYSTRTKHFKSIKVMLLIMKEGYMSLMCCQIYP